MNAVRLRARCAQFPIAVRLFALLLVLGCSKPNQPIVLGGNSAPGSGGGDAILVGGGGSYDQQIEDTRYGVILTMAMIQAGYDLPSLSPSVDPSQVARRDLAVAFLKANAAAIGDAIRKLDIKIATSPLSIPSPLGGSIAVKAKVMIMPDAPQGRIFLSSDSLADAVQLTVHEACHTFVTTQGQIGDFTIIPNYPEFNSGQLFLNDVGTYAQLYYQLHFPSPGAIDPSFGASGVALIPPSSGTKFFGRGIAIQSDGNVVVTGYAFSNASRSECFVGRLLASGAADSSFGTNGFFLTSTPAGAGCSAVAIQADGMIVAGGEWTNATGSDLLLLRLTPQGTLDTTLSGGTGMVINSAFATSNASALALQPDGKIVLVGLAVRGSSTGIGLFRYLPSGDPDPSFQGGAVLTPTGAAGIGLAIRPDGRLLVAGSSVSATASSMAIAQYNADGLLDSTFGGTGIVNTAFPAGKALGASLAIQPADGMVVMVGNINTVSGAAYGIVRFQTDGTLDTSFGNGGRVLIALAGTNALGRSVLLQPDGKLLVSGFTTSPAGSSVVVARLTVYGSTDSSFNPNGSQPGLSSLVFGSGDTAWGAIALAPNGEVYAVGDTISGNSQLPFVARLYGDEDPFYEALGF